MPKATHLNSSKLQASSTNPFIKARALLKLSQKDLANRLNTSLYALVRWERGDAAPTQDVLLRLKELLDPRATRCDEFTISSNGVIFESSGIRAKSVPLPPCDNDAITLLNTPRASLLDGIYNDNFWGPSALSLSDILHRRENPALTRTEPLDEDISAGKNTYTYDAHTYHTKVPPQGIASVIAKYLPEGGVVLDPFGGSGMTGVAARFLGYDIVLNELSPAACFIAYNFTRTTDTSKFNKAVSSVLEKLKELRTMLYTTECRECGKEIEQLYTVWSYRLECNHCLKHFTLWDHCRKYGNNVREHKLLRKFPCPHCGEEVNKSYLKRHKPVPAFIGYRCCSKKIMEHPLEKCDLQRIKEAKDLLAEYTEHAPSNPLPDGVNLNQPKRHGIDTVAKFYTTRNLIACAAIWREIKRIEDVELAAAVGFTFTSLYQRVTRLSEYRFWGGSGNTANFNVPHISNESNVFVTFERKSKSISDHLVTTAQCYKGRSAIRTGSATDLSFLPDNSIDFVFTDPPFGANINYSEMNLLWESWLGTFTDPSTEAIMNKAQSKGLVEYQMLMTKSLNEVYRVLRPEHWMVLVFMNSSNKVWGALRDAIEVAGFSIEKVNIFDKQHGTFKQFVSENTAGADLMIHCRKTAPANSQNYNRQGNLQSVAEFIRYEHKSIPVFPFLHVQREAEVDFRTLYSRYIAKSMHEGSGIVDFAHFRREASEALGSHE